MIKLVMPIYWTKEFKTKKNTTHLVGMSWYRNAHYRDQNNWKREFTEIVKEQIGSNGTYLNYYRLQMELYYKNKVSDGSNVIPVIEKVVLDALQDIGAITDDTVEFHLGSSWSIAGQDRENPRCEITLIEVEKND